MELFKANNQWATRPADETFTSVAEMDAACSEYRNVARTATVEVGALRVEAQQGEIHLVGKTGVPARLTHWAFGQLATRAGAPASYLRDLPATLAAQNLNHGLSKVARFEPGPDGQQQIRTAALLFHENGSLMLRAALSQDYSRIWNCDVTERLLELQERDPVWHLPKAYDLHNGTKGTPDRDGMVTRGAYASDHDMFCFLIDDSRKIAVQGSPEGLNRGFFVWNSEVGASSFGVMTFLFDRVCGNNIVWGAREVAELRVRHVGGASAKAFGEFQGTLRRYSESSASEVEGQILRAQTVSLGPTKDKVLDVLFGRRIPELNRKMLGQAYDIADRTTRYGDPRSVWGMVNGLTELSQDTTHADRRMALDRAAGKVLEIAF